MQVQEVTSSRLESAQLLRLGPAEVRDAFKTPTKGSAPRASRKQYRTQRQESTVAEALGFDLRGASVRAGEDKGRGEPASGRPGGGAGWLIVGLTLPPGGVSSAGINFRPKVVIGIRIDTVQIRCAV